MITKSEANQLPNGTVLLVQTADRKRPFKGTVNKSGSDLFLETKSAAIAIIFQADGSVSHVMRYAVRHGAMPTTTKLQSIAIA